MPGGRLVLPKESVALRCAKMPMTRQRRCSRVVSAGQRPTIRSGGHCYEDFYANNPNGTLIDMSMMNHVGALPQDARYRVGVGATLGQAYQELYKLYNVTLPGGTCGSVGAGGHITGGGYGLVSRLYGTTADWVTGVDILTVDSKGKVALRKCTATTGC